VYTEQGGERIALGQIINEGEVDEIEVPALEPGEYFFVCDLHVNEMQGTLVVEG
jgi:plastocyanin